jgi:hypothetical protein
LIIHQSRIDINNFLGIIPQKNICGKDFSFPLKSINPIEISFFIESLILNPLKLFKNDHKLYQTIPHQA